LQQRRVFRQLLQAAGDGRHPRKGCQRQRGEDEAHHLALRAGLADRKRRGDRRHQHAAPGRAREKLRGDHDMEIAGELGADHRERAEQAGRTHHDQPAAMFHHDARREHRDVESDPEHRHQPWQLGGRREAQIERAAVDGKMQLIAERQDQHGGDEKDRYGAERLRRFGRLGRRLIRDIALDFCKRERRQQQHHAGYHKRQPRVLVLQHDAEIGRDRAGQTIAEHRQRRQERDRRLCAMLAKQRQRRRAQRG
jgi:hypothetical protein